MEGTFTCEELPHMNYRVRELYVTHVWLTCMVMPSRVAFRQWWRGAPHIQLMCGSHVGHVHSNALTCSIPSMVEGSPFTYSSCVAHMWLTCTVMPSRVAFPQWWS